jgi:hypothetical protein
VSVWGEVFLGVIAVATLAMAIVLVSAVIAAGRLARRLGRLGDQLEAELKPIFDSLNAIGQEASRAAALTSAQVERVDRLFADVAARVDESVQGAFTAMSAPAREGRAILSALTAFARAMRDVKGRRRSADDEDALFI